MEGSPPEDRELSFLQQSEKGSARRTGGHVYFVIGEPTDQVILFHHIRKTAGTAMRGVINRNYPDAKGYHVHVPEDSADLGAWYDELVTKLRPAELERMQLVTGHTANWLLERLPRRIAAFTLVREPVDRVLSRFFFGGSERRGSFEEFYARQFEGDAHVKSAWVNFQSSELLAPHFDVTPLRAGRGPGPDADLWRARLFGLLTRHYQVLVQQHFGLGVEAVARRFGWTFTRDVTARVNSDRPRDLEISRETFELVCTANWLDVELYQWASARVSTEPGMRPGYRIAGTDRDGELLQAGLAPEVAQLALQTEVRVLNERIIELQDTTLRQSSELARQAQDLDAMLVKARRRAEQADAAREAKAQSAKAKAQPAKAAREPKAARESKPPKPPREPKRPVPRAADDAQAVEAEPADGSSASSDVSSS